MSTSSAPLALERATHLMALLANELDTLETTRTIRLADGTEYVHTVGAVSYTTQAHYAQRKDSLDRRQTERKES